mmetsp:Transcript_22522/g.48102  ORF Transcript_22522/g.48102 Transcript_22522/m.48102 type:complete len:328 (+) Transcript_22522:54-1037(+)
MADGESESAPTLSRGIFDAKYMVKDRVGKGRGGGAVYAADDLMRSTPVALKYPASHTELEVLLAIQEKAPNCLGVPRLLDHGFKQGDPYTVMDLLKSPLSDVFPVIRKIDDLMERWDLISMLGRLTLRRLEAIHQTGFVHGDVAPSNIVLGPTPYGGAGLFLVDFGSSRQFPGGSPVKAFWSTVEYTSVRVVDDVRRQPYDDLESLGYVLVHALFGDLPWFKWTQNRKTWEGASRDNACKRVREVKFSLLWGMYCSLGLEWLHISKMPDELKKYLIHCAQQAQKKDSAEVPVDYRHLAKLLGEGEGDVDRQDEKDLQKLSTMVALGT